MQGGKFGQIGMQEGLHPLEMEHHGRQPVVVLGVLIVRPIHRIGGRLKGINFRCPARRVNPSPTQGLTQFPMPLMRHPAA